MNKKGNKILLISVLVGEKVRLTTTNLVGVSAHHASLDTYLYCSDL